MAVGDRIQELRKAQKKSLRGLANEADISVAYLTNIEKNESSPTVEVLQRIAEALKVSVREITEAVEEASAIEMPPSLSAFIEKYETKFEELGDPDWQRALTQVKLRGRYPRDLDDWLPIFVSMRQALDSDA
jgi:transcriptional regulator with XRE-family HTH domain